MLELVLQGCEAVSITLLTRDTIRFHREQKIKSWRSKHCDPDPDTDSDPDADKEGMLLFTRPSNFDIYAGMDGRVVHREE
jgi:hypothetical protein